MNDFDPQPGTLDALHKGLEEMRITACEEDGRDYHDDLAQEAADALAAREAGWTEEKFRRLMEGAPAVLRDRGKMKANWTHAVARYARWPYVNLEFFNEETPAGTLLTGMPLAQVELV